MTMKKTILFLSAFWLFSCTEKQAPVNQTDPWKVGGKIHFEENDGADYIGLKSINKITKDILKSLLPIGKDSGADNAKILLNQENGQIIMTHYAEKSRPNVGEEMHATLLYTSPQGFCASETLHQVCGNLFQNCNTPPNIKDVVEKYNSIIPQDLKFEISEIIVTHKNGGPSFIMAKLSLEGRENIYKNSHPISAGLHMTFVNSNQAILSDPQISKKLTEKLNQKLKGQMLKVALKEGVVDLEFGLSGQPWRIRAARKIEFSKQ